MLDKVKAYHHSFAMYSNDLEEHLSTNGFEGTDIEFIKFIRLLYADDIVLIAESVLSLQKGLDLLNDYCNRWKLKVNVRKTKDLIFHRGGSLLKDLKFYFGEAELEIVRKYSYLGLIFTSGGSFSEAMKSLAGQARKGLFKLIKLASKFIGLSPNMYCKAVLPLTAVKISFH